MALNGEHVSHNQKPTITKSVARRRDADQKILDHFWIICDANESKRNNSLKVIIEILVKQNVSNIYFYFTFTSINSMNRLFRRRTVLQICRIVWNDSSVEWLLREVSLDTAFVFF